MRLTIPIVLAFALVTSAHAQRGTSGTTLELPLRLTGTAISAGGFRNPLGTARIEINLERLSTPAQRDALIQRLKEDGQSGLLDALKDAPSVGTIRFNTELAWDLRYAAARPGPENTVHLYLATDRPMSFREIWNQPQYSEYPFTILDLELRPGDKGKGTMILAAQVTADENGRFVQIENYGSAPVDVNNIETEVRR